MDKFIPKEKLSKKAKRALDRAQRQVWSISPVTRTSKNRKAELKDKTRYRIDDGIGSLTARVNAA